MSGFPFVSKMIGKIGSQDWNQTTFESPGQMPLSQIGVIVLIIFPLFSTSVRQEFRDVTDDDGARTGQPVSERAYTLGQRSFSSDTPSESVSVRAKARLENAKIMRIYFFIHSY